MSRSWHPIDPVLGRHPNVQQARYDVEQTVADLHDARWRVFDLEFRLMIAENLNPEMGHASIQELLVEAKDVLESIKRHMSVLLKKLRDAMTDAELTYGTIETSDDTYAEGYTLPKKYGKGPWHGKGGRVGKIGRNDNPINGPSTFRSCRGLEENSKREATGDDHALSREQCDDEQRRVDQRNLDWLVGADDDDCV
jgi:hypothetical protein